MRTCIGCRRRAPATELVRVALDGTGGLVLDRRAPGRGAWLCAASPLECGTRAARRRAYDRALRTTVRPGAVDALLEALSGIGAPSRSMGDCLFVAGGVPPVDRRDRSKG